MSSFHQHDARAFSPPDHSLLEELSDYLDLPAIVPSALLSSKSLRSHCGSLSTQVFENHTSYRAPVYPMQVQEHQNPLQMFQMPGTLNSSATNIWNIVGSLDHPTLLHNQIYQELFMKCLSLELKLESIQEAFNVVISNSNNQTGSRAQQEISEDNISSAHPLLAQLDRADYPNIRFWERNSWNRNDSALADIQMDGRNIAERGPARQAQGLNVSFTFAENENGTCLSGFVTRGINATAREVWQELKKQGKAPKMWLTGTSSVRNFYHVEMYRRHPELQFCKNHWKVDFIASHSYPGWHRQHMLGKTVKDEESSDDSPTVTLPQKRAALTAKLSAHPKKLKVPAAPKPNAGNKHQILATEAPATAAKTSFTLTISSSENATSSDSLSSVSPATTLSCIAGTEDTTSEVPIPMSAPPTATSVPASVSMLSGSTLEVAMPIPVVALDTLQKVVVNMPAPPTPVACVAGMDIVTEVLASRFTIMNPFENALEVIATDVSEPTKQTTRMPLRKGQDTVTFPITATAVGSISCDSAVLNATKGKGKGILKKDLMNPTKALTPRNLYAMDYCKDNVVTKAEFEAKWNTLDDATRHHYMGLTEKIKKDVKDAKAKAKSAAMNTA